MRTDRAEAAVRARRRRAAAHRLLRWRTLDRPDPHAVDTDHVGDPGVDALHYDLDLTWDPDTSVLTGAETLTFRSTEDDDTFQLDLEPALEVSEVSVSYTHLTLPTIYSV